MTPSTRITEVEKIASSRQPFDGASTAVFDIDYCRNDGVGGAFDQDALRLVMESQWGHC